MYGCHRNPGQRHLTQAWIRIDIPKKIQAFVKSVRIQQVKLGRSGRKILDWNSVWAGNRWTYLRLEHRVLCCYVVWKMIYGQWKSTCNFLNIIIIIIITILWYSATGSEVSLPLSKSPTSWFPLKYYNEQSIILLLKHFPTLLAYTISESSILVSA